MLDPDIPREAGEEVDGAVGGVRIGAVPGGTANNTGASTPPLRPSPVPTHTAV